MTKMETIENVVQAQLTSLDDTDCYASVWAEVLEKATAAAAAQDNQLGVTATWGGRGKGGRGLSRRTIQPKDVVVEDIRLAYLGTSSSGVCLECATLKLLSGHVYALIGRNGCGKSTLLRRINASKIPGLSPHLSTLYIPQEVVLESDEVTPLETVLTYHKTFVKNSTTAVESKIVQLEEELDALQLGDAAGDAGGGGDNDAEDQQVEVERICEEISALEEQMEDGRNLQVVQQQAKDALRFFGIGDPWIDRPCRILSRGQLKKVVLAAALFCRTDLLLLDEPNHLDVYGLLQLRRLIGLCQERLTTVLLISHDVDLINDVATDVISFSNQQLYYYPGNFDDFSVLRQQQGLHELRQHVSLEKKRGQMLNTLENLKKQATSKRGGGQKKARAIESHKKKLERQGIDKDDKGHRWTAQKSGTGIQKGSINAIDATTRRGLSPAQLLKQAEGSVKPPPDKAVQFVFRNTTCTWGEPLITSLDVGHGYQVVATHGTITHQDEPIVVEKPNAGSTSDQLMIVKKKGFLFDCVDLCVEEKSKVCILGENSCGKSTLLRILAKKELPLEGTVYHASGLSIGYFDQQIIDGMMEDLGDTTALSYLVKEFPKKTEQDLRGELTSFGLNPTQASTCVKFLSGGERSRLALVRLMLDNPPVLFLDDPTSNLDVESVEAMIHGLSRWNGTLVFVSHDANFIRSLQDVKCFVIVQEEGKLRRIQGGIDAYLKAFKV
jgi:ATP-binding cassette subfamily F protein 3